MRELGVQLEQPFPSVCSAGSVLASDGEGVPPNDDVSGTSLEREPDPSLLRRLAVNPNSYHLKLKHEIHCMIGGSSLCSLFLKTF